MRRHIIAGLAAIALGAGIAAGAVLGPLALRVIQFRTSANLENQFVGGEVVSLAVVAPALIVAGGLWLRQHRLAPALAFGPALYAVYTYGTAVVGQEYAQYDGNVEKFFPLYAALVAGGGGVAACAWLRLDQIQKYRCLRTDCGARRRASSWAWAVSSPSHGRCRSASSSPASACCANFRQRSRPPTD